MKIDLANIIEEWNNKQGWIYAFYYRGSILYGTSDENSDTDLLIITYDSVDIIPNENYVYDGSVKADKRIYQTSTEGYDYEIVKYSDFLSLIKEQSPLALEAIFDIQDNFYSKLRRFYKLDKWKLRESFGSIASNSFVKAKKKMTVKESYDIRCALKSLFHSIRLLMFACQIAEKGEITDFKCAVPLWEEINEDYKKGFVWEDFKKKYKPIWNEWHSKMVKLCPKPKELYKNNK